MEKTDPGWGETNNFLIVALANLLLQHAYIEDEKLAEKGKTCWQHCIQKMLNDIIGSSNTIPVKFEKVFWEYSFQRFGKYQRKGQWKVIILQSTDNFTKFKQTGNSTIFKFFHF